MKKLTLFLTLFGLTALNGVALAQTAPELVGLFSGLLEAFPILEVLFGGVAVFTLAPHVMTATEFFKVRLKKRYGDINNLYIHGINLLLSFALAAPLLVQGKLADEPALQLLPEPWGFIAFGVAVFLRAAGLSDFKRNTAPPTPPTDPTQYEPGFNPELSR